MAVRGKEKAVLLVKSGGVVLVRSHAQLLWPIYPCHSSRGCGGGGGCGLDETVRPSMKQREGKRLDDRGEEGERRKRRWMRMMRSRWRLCFLFFFHRLSACDAG